MLASYNLTKRNVYARYALKNEATSRLKYFYFAYAIHQPAAIGMLVSAGIGLLMLWHANQAILNAFITLFIKS